MKTIYKFPFCSLHLSISCLIKKIASIVDLPGTKLPFMLGKNLHCEGFEAVDTHFGAMCVPPAFGMLTMFWTIVCHYR
jgi:hypothetical protein